MTNAHFHNGAETFLSCRGAELRFVGFHPWVAEEVDSESAAREVREAAMADSGAGVGEIGLDRLKVKSVTPAQRTLFDAQLRVAADLHRPVVLHGARCWGEVLKAARRFAGEIPSFLFHGFSRSGGLMPDIEAMNGFVSVGKAVLNDHAVNYRELVKGIPRERLLVETDDDAASAPERDALLSAIFEKVAELTGVTEEEIDANAARFINSLKTP